MGHARGVPRLGDREARAGWQVVAVMHGSLDTSKAQESQRPADPPRRWPSESDFWRLWVIGTVQFGVRWIEMLAVGIFVYQQTGSAFLVTLLTLLRTLPLALFGAFVGAAADRLEGRTVLLLNTLVLLTTSATIAMLAYTDRLAIWHLAVATFISGSMWSTDMTVRRLMIGRVVGAARMGHAMVFDAGSNNVSRMAGPAIGGAVLALWGIQACFALGASMYLVAVVAAAGIRYRNPVPAGAPGLLLRTIFDAVDLARRDRRLLGILAITLIFNLFAWPSLSLIPVIGKDSLNLGPSGVGLLASMEGLGAILGVVTVYFLGRPALYPKLYVYSVLAYLVALTTFAMLPEPSAASLALLIAGAGGSGFAITQSTLAFQSTRPEMRGRILGLLSVAIGTGPIGFLQLGLLADAFGAPLAIVIAGCEGLLALALTRPLWREIRIDGE
jgi:MFS family permease